MSPKFEKLNKLAITCGGTGGHFLPGISLALKCIEFKISTEILISGKNSEKQRKKAEDKFKLYPKIINSKIKPYSLNSPLSSIKNLFSSYQSSKKILKNFKPNAVLSMGSFTSLPVVIAAKKLRIPVILHDSNAVIGKANRFLSRFADLIILSIPAENTSKISCPFQICKMPLRPEIESCSLTKKEALNLIFQKFKSKIDINKKVIFAFGGSQGAEKINLNLPLCINQLNKKNENFFVIHLTGKNKLEKCSNLYKKFNIKNCLLMESTDEMELFYSASDIIISRAGGATVAEIENSAKFAILIPFPYATENHQYFNAKDLQNKKQAEIILDKNCSPENLKNAVSRFINNNEPFTERKKMNNIPASEKLISLIDKTI